MGTVSVEKGGEIIPKITRVSLDERAPDSEPINYITHCPECNTELIRPEGRQITTALIMKAALHKFWEVSSISFNEKQ